MIDCFTRSLLQYMGMSLATLKWFKTYLSSHSQAIRIGSTAVHSLMLYQSQMGYLKVPFYHLYSFCIYLNDLPNVSKEWHLESYVEVSKLFLSFPLASTNSSLKKLKDDFPKVTTWCGENHLLTTQTRQRLCIWEPRNSWAGCLLRVAQQGHSLAIRLTSAKDRGVI